MTPPRTSVGRTALRLVVLGVMVWVLSLAFGWVMGQTSGLEQGAELRLGLIAVLLLAYAVLLAVPFVPGIELGLALLALHGADVAPLVYAATVLGLALSFAIGMTLPYRWLTATLSDLRLHRASALVARLEAMDRPARLAALRQALPARIGTVAADHPYLILAALLNLPGSALIGGGGGIALLAGLSGLYRWGATLLTLCIAVAPVPILIWAFDLRLPF
jgi:hypothetical protein